MIKKFSEKFSREKIEEAKKFDEKSWKGKFSKNKQIKIEEKTFTFKTKKTLKKFLCIQTKRKSSEKNSSKIRRKIQEIFFAKNK